MANPEINREYVSLSEAAKEIGLYKPDTLRRYIKKGYYDVIYTSFDYVFHKKESDVIHVGSSHATYLSKEFVIAINDYISTKYEDKFYEGFTGYNPLKGDT